MSSVSNAETVNIYCANDLVAAGRLRLVFGLDFLQQTPPAFKRSATRHLCDSCLNSAPRFMSMVQSRNRQSEPVRLFNKEVYVSNITHKAFLFLAYLCPAAAEDVQRAWLCVGPARRIREWCLFSARIDSGPVIVLPASVQHGRSTNRLANAWPQPKRRRDPIQSNDRQVTLQSLGLRTGAATTLPRVAFVAGSSGDWP